jgi:exodeoxyribonuclease V alpha subunit
VVRLQKSYRYGETSGIGALARAIRAGDATAALEVLGDPARDDVRLVAPDALLPGRLQSAIAAGYASFAAAAGPAERLASLDRFRLLCAVREGRFGAERLARFADEILAGAGALPPRGRTPASQAAGRPILVTRNAPHLGLYNGDVGVLAREPGTGLRAFFESPSGGFRSIGSARLPEHELCFAMTVHKSQGSEFDEVVLVLPEEPLPLLTRELVYTAVTRARRRVSVHASEVVLRSAISRRLTRASGLREGLWGVD